MSDQTEARPRLVYDDDCGFCTWCVRYAAARGEFEVVGFSDLTPDQLARLPDDYEDCSHLLTQDAVYSCGEGLEQAIARFDTPARYLALAFQRVPKRDRIREGGYHAVAGNRDLFGRVVSCTPPTRREDGQ
ncbi:thiol-disulfide oxidoreductase DCC family protein [Natrononativus amylolyticus]|uniref:thiol-disulfide oxidoreductase DCC family protein n=1 Tax=Natrononativus amylolyticus TaxID=2963434 RepID=UPI0020CDAE29|nr:DCC1-like thiol-disulfide oxidoreductase family protein [Natrononativus amylolyticus]